jgi:hypothetical protein
MALWVEVEAGMTTSEKPTVDERNEIILGA